MTYHARKPECAPILDHTEKLLNNLLCDIAMDGNLKLILVMGPPGAGKTSCARGAFDALDNAALIDFDGLMTVEPWEFGPAVLSLGLQNFADVARNMLRRGFFQIVLSGGVGNQQLLDELKGYLPPVALIYYFWLTASPEELSRRRVLRGRDGADTDLEFHRYLDSISPEPDSLTGVEYTRIDTTELDEHAAVRHMICCLQDQGFEFRKNGSST